MNNSSRHGFLRFAATAATAALLAGGLGVAQAGGMEAPTDPAHINAYMGIGFGPQVVTNCAGADVCESGSAALKIFGGYRFTPSLATEISYYYLGESDRTWGTGNTSRPGFSYIGSANQQRFAAITNEQSKTHVFAVGVALESEMFPNAFNGRLTNHLRVGLAVSRVEKELSIETDTQTAAAGLSSTIEETKNRVFPYVGAGLSYGLTPRIRLYTSADALINPDRKHYVFSVGGGGEF
jgi:OmpA-like transmembrane domain